MSNITQIKHIRSTLNYNETEQVIQNDTKFNGVILKSYQDEDSFKHHCKLINEEDKTLYTLQSRPIGYINKDKGLVCSFTKTCKNSIVPKHEHFTVIWFDEPISLLQLTNELVLN